MSVVAFPRPRPDPRHFDLTLRKGTETRRFWVRPSRTPGGYWGQIFFGEIQHRACIAEHWHGIDRFVAECRREIAAYLADPATREDGIKIMAARAGVDAKEYASFMPGTKFLSLAEGEKIMASSTPGFGSLVGSSKIADDFNVKNAVYKEAQKIADYIDASVTADALKASAK